MECISINYKLASEDIRNLFSKSFDVLYSKIEQSILLKTCNRLEIYVDGEGHFDEIEYLIADFSKMNRTQIREYMMYYQGKNAIKHLFNVAAGLESMVVGENEILSQVKEAYLKTVQNKKIGYELNTVFLAALSSSKKIKTETNISKSALSVATLACYEIRNFINENKIKTPKILVIGANGKTGLTVIKNLLSKEEIEIFATKRLHGIPFDVNIIDYSQRYQYLNKVDIIISATSSPHYTLTYGNACSYINSNKKYLFVDLASPFDIEREIKLLDNCEFISIDDFINIAKQNNEKKQEAVYEAMVLIDIELDQLYKNIAFHPIVNKLDMYKSKYDSLDKFLYSLKDRLDSKSFEAVIKVLEDVEQEKESLVC